MWYLLFKHIVVKCRLRHETTQHNYPQFNKLVENLSKSQETAVARQGGVTGRQTSAELMWACSRVRKLNPCHFGR